MRTRNHVESKSTAKVGTVCESFVGPVQVCRQQIHLAIRLETDSGCRRHFATSLVSPNPQARPIICYVTSLGRRSACWNAESCQIPECYHKHVRGLGAYAAMKGIQSLQKQRWPVSFAVPNTAHILACEQSAPGEGHVHQLRHDRHPSGIEASSVRECPGSFHFSIAMPL